MLTRDELEAMWRDGANWKLGVVYVCKRDPRLVVRKRLGWTGWTFNFAHARSFGLLVVVLAAAMGPTLALLASGERSGWWIAGSLIASATIAILLVLAAARIGRPPATPV